MLITNDESASWHSEYIRGDKSKSKSHNTRLRTIPIRGSAILLIALLNSYTPPVLMTVSCTINPIRRFDEYRLQVQRNSWLVHLLGATLEVAYPDEFWLDQSIIYRPLRRGQVKYTESVFARLTTRYAIKAQGSTYPLRVWPALIISPSMVIEVDELRKHAHW